MENIGWAGILVIVAIGMGILVIIHGGWRSWRLQSKDKPRGGRNNDGLERQNSVQQGAIFPRASKDGKYKYEAVIVSFEYQNGVMFGDLNELLDMMPFSVTFTDRNMFLCRTESGEELFQVINYSQSGKFPDLVLADQSIRGVVFLLNLDALSDPKECLEKMLGAAADVARRLKGEMLDEEKNPLTNQGVSYLRKSVREYTLANK